MAWHKGKCQKCSVAYRWVGGPILKKAKCPKCGGPLSWVSQDASGVWDVIEPPK